MCAVVVWCVCGVCVWKTVYVCVVVTVMLVGVSVVVCMWVWEVDARVGVFVGVYVVCLWVCMCVVCVCGGSPSSWMELQKECRWGWELCSLPEGSICEDYLVILFVFVSWRLRGFSP